MLESMSGVIAFLKAVASLISQMSCGSRLKRCIAVLIGESLCLVVRVVGSWYVR